MNTSMWIERMDIVNDNTNEIPASARWHTNLNSFVEVLYVFSTSKTNDSTQPPIN